MTVRRSFERTAAFVTGTGGAPALSGVVLIQLCLSLAAVLGVPDSTRSRMGRRRVVAGE
jgi:hypothetical protein